jgi:hypothetical protein
MVRRTIGIDELDKFQIDDNGQLYWGEHAVQLERRITLKGWELVIAACAAFGALLAGLHPFLQSFGFIK